MIFGNWSRVASVFLVLLVVLSSCNGGGGSNPDTSGPGAVDAAVDAKPGEVHLSGAVEKGPFVLGSTINISLVDPKANPTGLVFNTATVDDLGRFSVTIAATGNVSLVGYGNYYDEVSGRLSTGPITLRAYSRLVAAGTQTVFMNIVTHLAYERVKTLVGGGTELTAAITQAEYELRAELHIGPPAFDPGASGTQMSILGGDTDANAYLFAVSTVLAQSAVMTSTGDEEATLQELVNGIARDLASDGMLDYETVRQLRDAQAVVDPEAAMAMLQARLSALGSSARVPNLDRMIDTDLDGIMNAGDNCRYDENRDQADMDGDGIGDICECGNGTIQHGEECDDGNTVLGACTYGETSCTVCGSDCHWAAGVTSYCGDQATDSAAGELCDDGNIASGDGCRADCRGIEECGDGLFDSAANEVCDDGNLTDGDGCDSNCTPTGCGNGVITAGESCDDKGESATCDRDCTAVECGDGVVNATAGEHCDTAIAIGLGKCPTADECTDRNWCTEEEVVGTDCTQHCSSPAAIDECRTTADGCCPASCTLANDPDCFECPPDMARIPFRSACIDRYEASQGEGGKAVSVAGAMPWACISWYGARDA
ncbi:MAG: hypothetical protein V2A73_15290, partial [Pseudomonadota bacterium]